MTKTFDERVDEILRNLIIDAFQADDNATVSDLLPEAKAALYKAMEEKYGSHRYCGVCYRPSIERGGWWCPEHEYLSVYITASEADKMRQTLKGGE